ncbi:MAG: Phenylalanyl-tRNA synthetase subunit alpha, phenylalanyl-tRNA synthetase alpha chain [Candidatus Rokubacteria bacterium CSP1-6]|nr:MAG: Phenylalanyl-tRNA synthetase subunit alpha, phenylalanyl-tRNA synthetase alpha chain [Candidatus Rokubacteria bacterium CSP1-6]
MADKRASEILKGARGEAARAKSSADLEQVRVKYLGRQGILTQFLRSLSSIPVAERPEVGREANLAKAEIETLLGERLAELKAAERRHALESQRVDLTLPGRRPSPGTLHPLTLVQDEIIEIFLGLGFAVAEGPEVESDFYNFEALNIPRDHPARDMQDTFYLSEDVLLRTHTSPMQIRIMKAMRPPLRYIFPGRVYRRDIADASHSPVFHQVEGLAVDRNISMGDLKGTLELFAREMFGPRTTTRFRPSFFPFTEPSAEVDVRCFLCGGEGCRVCKQSGWLEILGSGMVHPQVLRNVGYDPEEVTGWAFGMGVERIAMLKYGIDDIRLFFENDLRFLTQFA